MNGARSTDVGTMLDIVDTSPTRVSQQRKPLFLTSVWHIRIIAGY
jgi:hypothetical protein